MPAMCKLSMEGRFQKNEIFEYLQCCQCWMTEVARFFKYIAIKNFTTKKQKRTIGFSLLPKSKS